MCISMSYMRTTYWMTAASSTPSVAFFSPTVTVSVILNLPVPSGIRLQEPVTASRP